MPCLFEDFIIFKKVHANKLGGVHVNFLLMSNDRNILCSLFTAQILRLIIINTERSDSILVLPSGMTMITVPDRKESQVFKGSN